MQIIHIWQDYSPNLFDRSHPLCLSRGVKSEILCQAFIENGAAALPATQWLRRRTPEESNSQSFSARLLRRIRRPFDSARFAKMVTQRLAQAPTDAVVHVHFGTTAALLATGAPYRRSSRPMASYGAV